MPDQSPWNLGWFYFGDLYTLMTGPCSSATNEERPELISALLSTQDPNSLPNGSNANDPPLIGAVRALANASRKRADYEWTKGWPFSLAYYPHTGGPAEIVVTPDTCCLPWPFPVEMKDEALNTGFKQEQKRIEQMLSISTNGATIPSPKESVYINTLLFAYEAIVVDGNKNTRDRFLAANSQGRRKMLVDYAQQNVHASFDLPDDLSLPVDENRYTDGTFLSFQPDSGFVFDMGWKLRPEPADDKTDTKSLRLRKYVEKYPCGAFAP